MMAKPYGNFQTIYKKNIRTQFSDNSGKTKIFISQKFKNSLLYIPAHI